jgi:putative oxidoreductase
MNMAPSLPSKRQTIAIWALRVVLGLVFLAIGTTKLTGTVGTVDYFAAIGWGQWFRYVAGLLDVAGSILLFVPRWTCYAAIVLTCTVGLGTVLSFTLWRSDPTTWSLEIVSIPLVLTLLAAVLAWLTRPHRAAG